MRKVALDQVVQVVFLKTMSNLKIEVTKFAAVGFLNLILTFAIFSILLKIFNIGYLTALCVTWVFGIVFSYTLNFVWVFTPEARLKFNYYFLKFCFSCLISFIINLTILRYSVERFELDPLSVQALLFPLLAILNFLTSKFWSLRSKKC